VFSLSTDGDTIVTLVQHVVDYGDRQGYNALKDQIKTYTGDFGTCD